MNPASLALLTLLLATPLLADAPTNSLITPTAPSTNAAPALAPADSTPATNTPASTFVPDAPPPPLTLPSGSLPPATATPQDEIADIRPPFFFLHSWLWLWIALALAALLAFLLFLWIVYKPTRLLSAKSAYDLTLEKLEKARALLREDDPMPYAVLVSETIRTYLGQRFQSPSTRRTTDEFLRLMENDSSTPLAAHRDLLRHFLQSCDLVKFAKYQPTLQELEDVQQRAWNFVTATKPLPEQSHGTRP